MFGWDESSNAYDQVQQSQNTGSFGHEVIGGAAGFAAMKIFEDRQRKEGKTVKHQFAKEALAGIAAAEVDKLAETKGEDAWDRHEAKQQAKDTAENLYDQHYVQGQGASEYDPNQYGAPQQFNGNYDHSW